MRQLSRRCQSCRNAGVKTRAGRGRAVAARALATYSQAGDRRFPPVHSGFGDRSEPTGSGTSTKVAEAIVDVLQAAGVRRCHGIVGDTLNRLVHAMSDSPIEWVHMRHEEAGAFAAQGEALATGRLTAVILACGQAAHAAMQPAPSGDHVLPVERRISPIFCGLADIGLGDGATALGHLDEARGQMNRLPVHLDWYWRLAMEWGCVHAHLANRDAAAALRHAEHLVGLAAAADARAWHALAWEARARVALMAGAPDDAVAFAARALEAGMHVPLAQWRVHAVAAAAFQAVGAFENAAAQADLCAAARLRPAGTLPAGHRSRLAFERRSAAATA
ncbi:thiamine pyrophosphate-binding protein [Burkholderia plantarii]|uniref:thiamine pyrophosphate-binding protein n=1 Tax=Burkholderia plantarii TaxID=41899 RepID=UPI0009E7FDD9|nr:thiamine pyrophosphate-binding protein [Burkholderia plantarii]